MQRCGRRSDGEHCIRPAESEVVESTTDEALVGVRLCDPCDTNLTRRGFVRTVPLGR